MKETLPCLFFLDLRFLITPLVSLNTSCSTFRTVQKYNRKETETKLISIAQVYMTSYFPSLSQSWDRIRILKFNLDHFSVNFCTFNRFTIISKSNICSFHVYSIVITTAFRDLHYTHQQFFIYHNYLQILLHNNFRRIIDQY